MLNYLEKEVSVGPSLCDSTSKLGIHQTLSLFMDIATEHAELLKIGPSHYLKQGKFWLTVRTKIRIYDRPSLADSVSLTTWPESPGKIRCNRDYTIFSGDHLYVAGKSEWAVLDHSSNRLLPLSEVYPEGLILRTDLALPEPFARIDFRADEGSILGTYRILSTDIDLGGHMNNVAYVRALETMYSSAEWNALNISALEVIYRAQCFENELLTIRVRQTSEGLDFAYFKEDGTDALLLSLTCG